MKHSNIAIFVPHAGCPYQCSFCDQHVITAQHALPSAQDVELICAKAMDEVTELGSTEIAFFGGSFTAIPRGYMLELLTAAQPYAKQCRGIRISTRPDCIDAEVLEILRMHHVTAIELGAQSMDDTVLAANDRGHTAEDVRQASRLIRAYGFELGLQVMPGLYQSSPQSDFATMEQVCAIRPDTVRIYPVVILNGTRLAELYRTGDYCPIPFRSMVEQVAAQMEHYRMYGIRIIKVGLHASEFVAKDALGGYYHPAFRELCENEMFRHKIEGLVTAGCCDGRAVCIIAVHPSCISKAVGQKKANLQYFYDTYGIRMKIIGDAEVPEMQCRIAE